jgi:hypothetical protein
MSYDSYRLPSVKYPYLPLRWLQGASSISTPAIHELSITEQVLAISANEMPIISSRHPNSSYVFAIKYRFYTAMPATETLASPSASPTDCFFSQGLGEICVSFFVIRLGPDLLLPISHHPHTFPWCIRLLLHRSSVSAPCA